MKFQMSLSSFGGHFVGDRKTFWVILVEGLMRNISVKIFSLG